MSKVVILIIVHKPQPDRFEEISLTQCYSILGKHPIYYICPDRLETNKYLELIPNAQVRYINPEWQKDYRSFNRLKISPLLYKIFSGYEYILFYEPDAFVFRDELDYWCDQGYDYIGAPWFEKYHESNSNSPLIGVGNGGFSLRRVSKFLWGSRLANFIRPKLRQLNIQEDLYWVKHIAPYYPGFKIPSTEIGLRFAFEIHPKTCFDLNGNKLPFGIHAWQKYDLDFWKPYIEAEGYVLP